MKKRFSFLLLFCMLGYGIISVVAAQEANIKLFKSYAFNAPIGDFLEADGYYDCSEEIEVTARCIDNVEFLGHTFTAILRFDSNKLEAISLLADFDQNLYFRVIGALGETFNLCALQGATERLDLIELAKSVKDKATYQSKLAAFESLNLKNGNLTYIFIEQTIAELRSKKNAVEAILSAPEGTRAVELVVTEDETVTALEVFFSLPKLAMKNIKSAMEAPAEEF